MRKRRAAILCLWLLGAAAAAAVVTRARYITDLSAFLPANPTPVERLLVDQLRNGPASRLILVAVENGTAAVRARVAIRMAERLRGDRSIASVEDGEPQLAAATREFLFEHRYLLSDEVDAARFTGQGLTQAIGQTLEDLATSTGLMLKALVPRDPTGEMLHVVDQLASRAAPRTAAGVWASADGSRTLLVVQTAAAGSDTDGQEAAIQAVRSAFESARTAEQAADLTLRTSGPGVFAVAARASIKTAATRLSIVSSLLVSGVLLAVYRSVPALLLGLLPVASGAVAGIAAVALGFGAVHGITLGFGITLIGESVDYSIYFFVQSRHGPARVPPPTPRLWPTIRLGMLTSVCGFASLLPSGFPGLAQLGLYSISGLITAALVTRYVLPELLPQRFEIRDVAPVGRWIGRRRDAIRAWGPAPVAAAACALGALCLGVLHEHRSVLWNHDLALLSPVPAQDLHYDAVLRADLGAADVLDIVVVEGGSPEAVLEGTERAAVALQALVDEGVIAGFDGPAQYLPSRATQQRRRAALPDRATLMGNLRLATAQLGVKDGELAPFVDDVEAARSGPLLDAQSLHGTSLAAGFDALMLHDAGRWSAMMPLHAPIRTGAAEPVIDAARIRTALADAHLTDTQLLDVKAQTDALYARYLREAIQLSEAGFALIAVLLLAALRTPLRAARVLAPLVLAVLCVAAALALGGVPLTILHLVGMLLIVAVGSNYALFFDRDGPRQAAADPLTLASLALANLCTVIGFGLLSFSHVPVLEALGETVAPGAFLALLFAAIMTGSAGPAGADA